ncbi:MAG TPA: lipid IV(A) 3-deoxy-D-manno-octulosonic acid transferase, partial [Gammaproteobacteria bacterium]|nr:lipid IV(A) 3-deoxy-D-manno-octulosonic acid transferase [Gammaproteobacteria bacterium]
MRILYSLLLYLLTPLVLLRLAWRGLRAPAYWRRWPERFGFIEPPLGERVIWIHAVSVGEVLAAVPLVRALLEKYPAYSLLVTTVTPTGSAQVAALFGSELAHVYAPYDLPGAVRRFFHRVRPQLAIIMETEIWPNLFHACETRQVPLLLVNARLSARSLAGYLRVKPLVTQTLARLTGMAAQGETDAARFEQLGAPRARITVSGNLKFEQRIPHSLRERAEALRRDWGADRPVWVAASTHQGEDELLLDVHNKLRKRYADCLLVLVPRHPERFQLVAQLCRQRGLETVLRSERRPCTADTAVFVGDSMGELLLFLAAADVAFVGGSLVPHGGHNLLEPAALGLPVVTGPHVFNFTEICKLLLQAGACEKV